ncbi:MAG TPA: hypothetical protein VH186_19730 [Chloroflexia bacterium]|nr:hypothetical protein [Chloroflexia bacterium]
MENSNSPATGKAQSRQKMALLIGCLVLIIILVFLLLVFIASAFIILNDPSVVKLTPTVP